MTDFIRDPRREDLATERRVHFAALGDCQVGSVALSEQGGDAIVFVDQRSTRDFSGMRGEH